MKYPLQQVRPSDMPAIASKRRRKRLKPFRLGQHIAPPLTADERQRILDRDWCAAIGGWRCPYCERIVTSADGVHVDHVVARQGKWKRGGNSPSNLVTCCVACNLSKGNKPLDAWLSMRGA